MILKIVAEKTSISEGFLRQVGNDVNSPSVDTLVRICNAIGIDAGDLLTHRPSKQEKIIHAREVKNKDALKNSEALDFFADIQELQYC